MKKFTFIFFSLISYIVLCITLISHPYASNLDINSLHETSTDKVVYLTFDDGPGGEINNLILDTLKNENVPATFFVIGNQIKGQEDIILRMKNEGHSIGLHSFSHERNKLYCSNNAFLEEMLYEQEILHNVTGENYNIIRFPFGCNNKTYKLTQSMIDLLHENNFRVYDWTTDSGDGANHKASPQSIIKKSCNHKNNNSVVILMHCSRINKNTSLALPEIIKYYKLEGYTFKAIDDTTPEIYKFMKK